MIPTAAALPRTRRVLRHALVILVIVALAIVGLAVYRSAAAAGSLGDTPGGRHAPAPDAPDGAVTAADGLLPDGATAFDEGYPGVARLSPALLDAVKRASTDAASGGVVIRVNSGWRSAEYQDRLLQEAVEQYGSAEEAARWVASPETSAHVAGDAVDVGSYDAVDWLAGQGAAYGLCQTYGNEPWHFELRPEAVDRGCPPPYIDPTQDPRAHG
ncbi:M15 family metallopeptidase [Microbacterium sp. LWH7-1.2]|uniref:M15 family metallopeptidase n=1 Tax=Microbacterium sp. LWH7-1.2 TaxID=3135257 RepID=UPI003138B51C